MTFDDALRHAARCLADAREASSTPRLDAELLLAHVTGTSRVWLYTWGDREITAAQQAHLDGLVAERLKGRPIAYLVGEREFWGLRLATNEATLIPRPDTETLVEAALSRALAPGGRLLDLGCGTGAVGLAFAHERPSWQVLGVDKVTAAVELARGNACALNISNIAFRRSDWFDAVDRHPGFDLVVSNPPYLAAEDPHLSVGDLRHEPRSALVADQAGLSDLKWLIGQAAAYLVPTGWLVLEHGHQQGQQVRQAFMEAGYKEILTLTDLGERERVTAGQVAR